MVGKVMDADVATVQFTNMSGEEVLCIPYDSQRTASEVLVLLSQKVGVPSSGIDLLRTDGRLVQCPDNASLASMLEDEGPDSLNEPTAQALALLTEKAKELRAQWYGIGGSQPLMQWCCSDESEKHWERLKSRNLSSRLNVCLGLDPDSPVDLEQSFSTECQYQLWSSIEWLHAFFLSNKILVVVLDRKPR